MAFRRLTSVAIACCVGVALVGFGNGVASASGPCGGYGYSAQLTASTSGAVVCPGDSNPYYGYNGVDGQIQTPPQLAPIPINNDAHSIGYVDANFNTANSAWLQIGWASGLVTRGHTISNCTFDINCIYSYNQYLLYFEQLEPNGFYFIKHMGSLGLSGLVTYRIQYSSSDNCWLTYYNNSTLTDSSCVVYPISGFMAAANETWSGPSGYMGMPMSNFGSATPNTNQTMRLHGASGWADWSAGVTTAIVQNRPDFAYSPYVTGDHRHFQTYGAVR